MTIERQQGKRRVRTPRPGENAVSASTVLSGPIQDPVTGRFLKENQAHRLRALKRQRRELIGLDPEKVVPWLREPVQVAQERMRALVTEYGVEDDTGLVGLAEQAATSHAIALAYLTVGAQGDLEALAEARHWMREYRQAILALRGERRAGMPGREQGETGSVVDAIRAHAAAASREGDPDAR